MVPRPTVTIIRSRDGTVYSGTRFVVNFSISFSETLTDVDIIALAIGWSIIMLTMSKI